LNSNISDKDKKDWKTFLSSNEKIHNKDEKFSDKKVSSIKSFDLHGYSLDEANIKISEFIRDSYEKGLKKLIIVTGKGIHSQNEKDPYISKNLGILKYSVPEYIKNSNELMSLILEIKEASKEDGGGGAFYLYLKKKSIK
tara:strand:- start:131 stop:550 length:420 start_codon:yes stop_codon:yes gene_type:complete